MQAREAASFASDVVRHLRSFLRNDDGRQRTCAAADIIQDVLSLIFAEARDNRGELREGIRL